MTKVRNAIDRDLTPSERIRLLLEAVAYSVPATEVCS